jgi:hypothetical protein
VDSGSEFKRREYDGNAAMGQDAITLKRMRKKGDG